MAGELTVRLQRGDVVIELRGDAEAVAGVLADLKASGLGAMASFFGVAVTPVGIGTQSLGGQTVLAIAPTLALTHPTASFHFVFDSLSLRTAPGLLPDDVDGDGRPDNQFAKLIAAFEGLSLDFQGQINSELQSGSLTLLLTVATELATPAPDQRAAVALLAGKPVKKSAHVYIIDPLVPPVTLQGRITAGRFVSEDPRTGGLVVHRDIQLVFAPNASLTLPIQGLRLAFDISADGSAVSKGQLTGSIKETDVRSQMIPALAATMTELIKNDPTSPVTQNIQKLFDLGGCINPSGTAAQASDGVIDVCELLTSSLVMSLLQPDVQIYDAQGNYAPNPLHGNPDSMSIALGFSATVASY